LKKQYLIPAIDDMQRALGLLDNDRRKDENDPSNGNAIPSISERSGQDLTKDCRRLLDRLEKEYNRPAPKKTEKRRQRSNSGQKPQQQQHTADSQNHRQKPRPESTNNQNDRDHSTSHAKSYTKEAPAPQVPGTVAASAAQQKKDVMRLLLARHSMQQEQKGANGKRNGSRAPSSRPGEAFFLLQWNWWVQFCRYVDLFDLQLRERSKNGKDIQMDTTATARIQRVLALLPPGAVFPDKIRPDPMDGSKKDGSSEDSDDDSEEEDGDEIIKWPGPIDNSFLLVDPSDRFYREWYDPDFNAENESKNHPPLKPNLVRGYHFELIPREVYNALRSWYGETTPSLCRRTTAENGIVLYPTHPGLPKRPSPTTLMISRRECPRCNTCRASGAIRKCQRCMSVQYCDKACQQSHWPIHRPYCNEILAKMSKMDEDTSQGSLAESILPLDSNGRVGLNQLGNTCFMNSVLQSLSHATPLTRFFLTGRFKSDLNTDNPIGAGGKLALAYETVMRELWMKSGVRAFSPVSLKRAIASFAPRFAGCLQHDAPEFLAFLLDGLHEDLNRIRKAPYVEMPDVSNGQNMAIAAAEAWDAHKRRNDSLVMDTFYGQFQSTCICPQCNRVSVSFDAFNHVSVEIPQQVQSVPIAISVVVVFADGRTPLEVGVPLRRQAPVAELKKRVSEYSLIPVRNLTMALVSENRIYKLIDDKMHVSMLDLRNDVIVAYEINPDDMRGGFGVVVTHCMLGDDHDDKMDKDVADTEEGKNSGGVERKLVGIPFITTVPNDSSCHDLYRSIWGAVRRMIVNSPSSPAMPEDPSQERIFSSGGLDSPEDVLTIRVVDSRDNPREVFEVEQGRGKTSILPTQSTTPLSEILGPESLDEYLFLFLEWKNPPDAETPIIDFRRFFEIQPHPSLDEAVRIEQEQALKSKRGVTLDQCFQSFSRPERLDENNMWYCSRCKDHVCALKTMKLWRLPNILVVHLKRFHGFRRDKLDTYVHFPFENLDMDPYTAHWTSASEGDKAFVDNTVPAEYDLFAVVNHYGRMGFGHYTAFAMQWDETGMSRDWNLFDDSTVRPVHPNEIRTSAAYILFYRRRQFN
jgi:ubiquitin carboxyl-terminal hydrolase 4/11/15